MNNADKLFFEQLKKEISQNFLTDFPSCNPDISQWKGLDIIYFQENLRQKVRGNVSEKWFYTYFKSPFEKLPRIDMLNLLCQYCGYKRGWNEFIEKYYPLFNSGTSAPILPANVLNITEPIKDSEKTVVKKSANPEFINSDKIFVDKNPVEKPKLKNIKLKYIYATAFIIIACISLFLMIAKYIEYKNTYNFYFYDADRGSLINSKLDIIIQKKGFSPEYYRINKGCFTYRSTIDTLYMIVSSPLYKKETFIVGLKEIKERGEDNHKSFKLRPDDYAIMLTYYSSSFDHTGKEIDDKQRTKLINSRREELNKLIADDALIYQIYDSEIFGGEILSKKKYIDFMVTPTTSLKNYVLIKSEVNKYNKITLIKFKIKKDEN